MANTNLTLGHGLNTQRLQQLQDWLNTVLAGAEFSLAPASADASFRRYFRVALNGHTLIAMDAPPEHEDCQPFIHAAEVLAKAGLNVPHVLEKDLAQGFLLLSDLGDTTYLQTLTALATDAAQPSAKAKVRIDGLYRDACDALVKLQLASQAGVFPPYDEALLMREMRLFPDWYIAKHLQSALDDRQQAVLDNVFALLVHNALAQPQVYVHRDYHSRNLMLCDVNPGILDFQDAVYGPITYDLVSLMKDAYIHWPEEQIMDWVVRYWQSAKKAHLPVAADFADFYRDFEWMGVQRHLKVLGIFSRLSHRDGKDGYLKELPLVMEYLCRVCSRYTELRPLLRLLHSLEKCQPAVGYTF